VADVPLPLHYAGRVAGFRVVEIRSQVGGFLQKREFVDGEPVKAGDVLFRIDPRSYEAALARAKALVAQAQATLTQATENYARIQGLAAQKVSTQKALEDATAARELATAALASAKADVQTAELNLEYTVIRAPISGLTSIEASPPEGTLIQPQQTVLTRITQLDPAYVYFTTTDSEQRELREVNEKRAQPLKPEDVTVQLQFGNGDRHPIDGKIDSSSGIVDPRTARCRSAPCSPTRRAACCRASSCGSTSWASPCPTPSWCRRRPSCRGRRVPSSTSLMPTTWRRPVRSRSTAKSGAAGS
jgi:membrane fusion protein (multidrug efflux system)